MRDKKHIHLIAVCGTGMTALAGLLKRAGYSVSGSDQNIYPPMSDLLAELEIPCFRGFDPADVPSETDLVVIGNAVGKSNPQVASVLERGLPYLSMPQALARFFLENKDPIVVTGTHGKTTVSALLGWILESAGMDPGLMVGGWAKDFAGNHKLGGGRWFVVEGDEYDTAFFDKGPKFLHYRPRYAILTSVEFDHADIYPNLGAVRSAFQQFVRLLPSEGFLVAAGEDGGVSEVLRESRCPVITYGMGREVDWRIRSVEDRDGWTFFDLTHRDRFFGRFQSPLMGRHNVKNATAVVALLSQLGIEPDRIREGLLSFNGVKRRQERVGEQGGVLIMDDFAHHPTAVSETLAAARARYAGRRLWAVFEPRSATSRRNTFQREYASALAGADLSVMVPPFAVEKIPPDQRLDVDRLAEDLRRQGREAFCFPTAEDVVREILPRLRPGDLVVVMSSGGFDGIHEKLLRALSGAA